MSRRVLLSIHRVLGGIFSIFFLIWFLSGFVMMYHTFPEVTDKDRYNAMDVIEGAISPVDSVLAKIPSDKIISQITLKSFGGIPYYELTTSDGVYKIAADTNRQVSPPIPYSQIKAYAKRWSQSKIVKEESLQSLDQWTPFGYLRKDFPIYKFYFADNNKHQLYVSSVSGEALQFTDTSTLIWAWLGAIPHLYYFSFLCQNPQLWTIIVGCLSALGSVVCIMGLVLGVRMYRKRKELKISFRKSIYEWHYILGLIFGLFVFIFIVSGFLSSTDISKKSVIYDINIREKLQEPRSIGLEDYFLDYGELFKKYQGKVKSIEWTSFSSEVPIYKVVVEDTLIFIDANLSVVRPLELDEIVIKKRIRNIESNKSVQMVFMTEHDDYSIGFVDEFPLPFYRVIVSGDDQNTYYINPLSGDIQYINTNAKIRWWTYKALHTFKFKLLVEYPALRYMLVWVIMVGGVLVCLAGGFLSFRYLTKRLNKRKRT